MDALNSDQPGKPTCERDPETGTQSTINDEEFDDIGVYFVGPRDPNRHSKWPIFLQLYGSVTPYMIFPLLMVAIWATLISCISHFVHDLGIDRVLLTVLGFVVGLSLSFRNSTAYERYAEGRKYWAQLSLTTQNLARLIWVYAEERPQHKVEDLLAKVTFCNMLATFSVALMHKLRFEPFTHYEDLHPRLGHLPVIAKDADPKEFPEPSRIKLLGLALGLALAESNPRKLVKQSKKPLGNTPLEILSYCSKYIKTIIDNGTFKAPIYQTQALNLVSQLNDVMTGTDRILNTPLPVAYSIAIGQITWVYILVLPFQLWTYLQWVTIPATIFAAYVILGLGFIGQEIENPFGDDVNDLPLEIFCEQIRQDIDIIMAGATPTVDEFIAHDGNLLLHPLNNHGYHSLKGKSEKEIRSMLKSKINVLFDRGQKGTPKKEGMVSKVQSKVLGKSQDS